MQTIKRTAAIFLVLMLVLSCFTPVLTASASEPPGSAPAQTAATSPGADDPPPETTAATEQTIPSTSETTSPTEETLPPRQMVSTLASFLESWDASVSITFSDGFLVEAGTQLSVTDMELDDTALTACMEAAGFLNILDCCVLNLDIPDADWEGTSFEMKVYFNSSAFRALNGNCVSVVRLLPDGTMERLEATPLVEEKALKEVSFTVTDFSRGTKAALYTASGTAVNVEKGMIRVRKGVSGAETTITISFRFNQKMRQFNERCNFSSIEPERKEYTLHQLMSELSPVRQRIISDVPSPSTSAIRKSGCTPKMRSTSSPFISAKMGYSATLPSLPNCIAESGCI